MIVEQVDAFKSWLTAVLKPMCEADPAALAKYVLALIKKDKSEEDLRKSMVGQLDVFLEGETESFVNRVFETLTTKDYIQTPVIPNANPPNPNIPVVKPTKELKENKVIISPSELPSLNGSGDIIPTPTPVLAPIPPISKPRKLTETEEQPKPAPRRSRNRSRSRSRSWDRLKRSRSREKIRPRTWRNKSPPRRYERRRSRSGTPTRLRSRSRSPRHSHRPRYRSRSLEKRTKEAMELSRPGTPTQDSNHGDLDLRLTNSTQSIKSVVVQQPKKRCRDFDEKGYCMRGEMCPYDHGVDPVVVEDASLSTVLTYNPNVCPGPFGTGMMAPEYNPQAPQIYRSNFRNQPHRGPNFTQPPPNMQRELIPVPVLGDNNKMNLSNFKQGYNMDHEINFKQTGGYNMEQEIYNNNKKGNFKSAFDFNRLGPRSKTNCSLGLKKVPPGLNSITHLNNHFNKFGKIVNIQVQFEGDPEAAIVTFSSHAEANAAIRSTEAVLNNRFIRVFWFNGTLNEGGKQEKSIKERLGNIAPNTNKMLNLVEDEGVVEKVEKPVVVENKEELKAQATAAVIKNQELLAAKEKLKKNQDEQRKKVLKIKCNLQKRKQELLEKQLSQQKILIEKMEKLPQGSQRDLIKETIKKTQESIEAIKKDLEQSAIVSKLMPPKKKSKEECQREMLDAELDLITKQQEGGDTSEVQKKLLELKAKVAEGGLRGRGGVLGAGRGRRFNPILNRSLLTKNNLLDARLKSNLKSVNQAAFQKHTVDHRPTRLLVSGYETDEQESVLAHFRQFGEIVDYVTDATLPSITLNYKSRKEAEMALLKGKHFQDRTLSITWSINIQLNSQGRTGARNVLTSETDEEHLIDQTLMEEAETDLGPEIAEEVLLQDDEEEDDESEDRSWRR